MLPVGPMLRLVRSRALAIRSPNIVHGLQIGQTSNSRTGWTIGGGVEWMFAPHWSAFLEGNYMDFGSTSGNVTAPGLGVTGLPIAVSVPVTVKATESDVLVGVNYHFF